MWNYLEKRRDKEHCTGESACKCSSGTEGYDVFTEQSTEDIRVSATLLQSQRLQKVF